MPKKPINYQKACVYRLIYNDITYYVGSTTNMRQRKSQHRRGCYNEKNKDYNYQLYKFIRENEGFNNWKMIMVHAYPECKTSEELMSDHLILSSYVCSNIVANIVTNIYMHVMRHVRT